MSYLSLYRQWRPQFFEDIVGQDHIVRTLKNAIQNGRVVHAYMFAGPRGTGKTSTAKVFAKALNCELGPTVKPCGKCVSCIAVKEGNALDVIEIDAASNRGIDEIRDLRDKVRFSPAQGRYKVYIIDEVHMLTMEAFNALLKTLEEPPSHAIFILATTEANRVPPTILSRCQRFDFNRLSVQQLTEHLMRICDQIGVRFEKEALQLIARRAEGSARDALGLLEQVSSSGETVTSLMIADLLGSMGYDKLSAISGAISNRSAGELYPLVSDALSQGTDPRQLLGEMGEHFMDLLLSAECPDRKDLLRSGEDRAMELSAAASRFETDRLRAIIRDIGIGLAEVAKAPNPRLTLELFLARLIYRPGFAEEAAPKHAVTAKPQALEPSRQRNQAAAEEQPVQKETHVPQKRPAGGLPQDEKEDKAAEAVTAKSEIDAPAEVPAFWGRILEELRRRSIRVEAFARQAKPVLDGKVLTLEYSEDWGFHHQKMKEPQNQEILIDIVKMVAGDGVELRCVLSEKRDAKSVAAAKAPVKEEKPAQPLQKQKAMKEDAGPKKEKAAADPAIVKESLEKAKALFSEVEIKIEED